MTQKDILRIAVESMKSTQLTREWIQTESSLLHGRIEGLVGALGLVSIVLKNRGLEDSEIQALDSVMKSLNDESIREELRRISSFGVFQRDQTAAEIEDLERMIDGMPDE